MNSKDIQQDMNELVQKAFEKAEQNSGYSKEFVLEQASKKDARSVQLVVMFRRECSQSLYLMLSERDFSEKNSLNDYLQENLSDAKKNLAKEGLKASDSYLLNSSFRFVSKYLFENDFFKKTEDAVTLHNQLSLNIDDKNLLALKVVDFNIDGVEDKRFFIVEDEGELKIAMSYSGVIGWSSKDELEKTIAEEEEKLNNAKDLLNTFVNSKAKKNTL